MATPQGLVVPVVRGAEQRSIAEIAGVRADLVSRARDGKLRSEDLAGGTFTISNLGMYDVDQFIAVLNPPQASILAVGATRDQVVPRDGDLEILPLMTLTLTCDHRAVDGATGADFLRSISPRAPGSLSGPAWPGGLVPRARLDLARGFTGHARLRGDERDVAERRCSSTAR